MHPGPGPKIKLKGFVLSLISKTDLRRLPSNFSTSKDLNSFFQEDACLFEEKLLAKTYKSYHEEHPGTIIGLVSLLNDALPFFSKSQQKKHVPYGKRWLKSFPAVKIGRLAINKDLMRMRAGSLLLVQSVCFTISKM